jgi:hypothetical protein
MSEVSSFVLQNVLPGKVVHKYNVLRTVTGAPNALNANFGEVYLAAVLSSSGHP